MQSMPQAVVVVAEPCKPKEDPNSITLDECDKCPSITLWRFDQPYMRALHLSWLSFFTAFTAWFAVAPLNSVIKKSLHLKKEHILKANFASVTTTVFMRILIGPLTDKYGPKTASAVLMVVGAIPVFCVGLIKDWQGLVAVRAAIGILGASFVPTQAWTTLMFQKSVVGTANAIVGGWGNLGGGFTQFFMVEVYESFRRHGMTINQAWRTAFIVPGLMLIVVAVIVYVFGKDTPKGDMRDLKKQGYRPAPASKSITQALALPATWLLALQYSMSFGVELVVFNMAEMYMHETFKVSVVQAGRVASLGGIGNIVTRAAGGMLSDYANYKYGGMRARLTVQMTLLVLEGLLLLWFSYVTTYNSACLLLLAFSVFVQAANGSCFGIVPYVSNKTMGSVSGLVGAGGNIGAMLFSLMFIYAKFSSTAYGFRVMGFTVLAVSLTTFLIKPPEAADERTSGGPMDATAHMDDDDYAPTAFNEGKLGV